MKNLNLKINSNSNSNSKNSLASKNLIIFGLFLQSFILQSCNFDKSVPNIELIQDMMESPSIKSQEYDEGSPNHIGMRVPPEGTQPQGFKPYKFAADFEASKNNTNPISGQFDEETLKVGIKYYTIHCSVCHGSKGQGGDKMSVAETMALKPPSMLSDKIRGWADGQIYHVITMGQGVMGPYAADIPAAARWQIVNYIRHLQKTVNAADIELANEADKGK